MVDINIRDSDTGKIIPHKIIKKTTAPAPATNHPTSKKKMRRSAMSSHDIEKVHETNYLKEVIIENYIDIKPDLLDVILTENIFNFSLSKSTVDEVVNELDEKKKTKKEGIWTYCTGSCVDKLKSLIQREINSTAYMLRFLSNSTIDITADKEQNIPGKHPLKFSYNNPEKKPITGEWENDKELFDLQSLDLDSGNARFIAGLGPSAAGKTYWAKNIIKLLGKTEDNFPKSFLSIDGGATREYSVVYQDIIKALGQHPKIAGLNNLVSAGWDPFHASLFKAGKIKKSAIKYLQEQKQKHGRSMVSLYVPETLGSPMEKSHKKISKFVDITNDLKWIGLYIWQHRTAVECTFPDNLKCVSTTDSGKSRELTEGKKYSSKAYNFSKKHGMAEIKKATGAIIAIHNSGGKKFNGAFNKSTVTEYPNAEGKRILNQTLLDDFNSVYKQGTFNKTGGNKTRKYRKRSGKRKSRRKRKARKKRKTRRLRRKQRGGKISPLNLNKQRKKEEERSQQAEEDASNEEETWEEAKHPCEYFEEENSCKFAQDHDCWWDGSYSDCCCEELPTVYDSDGGHKKRKTRKRKKSRRKSRK